MLPLVTHGHWTLAQMLGHSDIAYQLSVVLCVDAFSRPAPGLVGAALATGVMAIADHADDNQSCCPLLHMPIGPLHRC